MYSDLTELQQGIDTKTWKFWSLYLGNKCILPYGSVSHGANDSVIGYLASPHTPKGIYQVKCKIRLSAPAENVVTFDKLEGTEASVTPLQATNTGMEMNEQSFSLIMKAATLEAENKYLALANADLKNRVLQLEAQLSEVDTGLSDGPDLADRLEQLAPVLTPVLTTLSDLASRYFNVSLAEKEAKLNVLQQQLAQPSEYPSARLPQKAQPQTVKKVTLRRRSYEPTNTGHELANSDSDAGRD